MQTEPGGLRHALTPRGAQLAPLAADSDPIPQYPHKGLQTDEHAEAASPWGCLVSTLNSRNEWRKHDGAYSYQAYWLYFPQEVVDVASGTAALFETTLGSTNAPGYAAAADDEQSGIVRMARCRVPDHEQAREMTMTWLRRFGQRSWLKGQEQEREHSPPGRAMVNQVAPVDPDAATASSDIQCSAWDVTKWWCPVDSDGVVDSDRCVPLEISCVSYEFVEDEPAGGDDGGVPPGYSPLPCETNPDGTNSQLCVGGGGGGVGLPPPPSNAELLEERLEEDEYLLLEDLDCGQLDQWQSVANHTPPTSVMNRLEALKTNKPTWWDTYIAKSSWDVQELAEAEGGIVNLDYWSATVSDLPGGMSAMELYEHIRTNLNDFVDTNISEFEFYPGLYGEEARWLSNDPLGTIFSIQIHLPGWFRNDGSVITSAYTGSGWIFTTIHTPADWTHPVSGNRQFGFADNGDGTYTFFTRGVDRVTTLADRALQWGANQVERDLAFDEGDNLWGSFLNGLEDYVESNGGDVTIHGNTGDRVDWDKLEAVVNEETLEASSYEGCSDTGQNLVASR